MKQPLAHARGSVQSTNCTEPRPSGSGLWRFCHGLPALLALLTAPPAWAQFDLYLVQGGSETPTAKVHDLGAVFPGDAATARFHVRNTSGAPAAVTVLAVEGLGFSISGAPALPATLEPQAAIEFTVIFQAVNLGAYSASLRSNGISLLLLAAVVPSLTYEIEIAGSLAALGPIAFGSVEPGQSAVRTIVIENLTPLLLTVPAIGVQGAAFALTSPSPSGGFLQPRETARFEIAFRPPAAGSYAGTLVIGGRAYALSGTSINLALPKPSLVLDPGAVSIRFDAPARIAGAGLLTLEFQPLPAGAADAAVAFANGLRSIEFFFVAGDRQGVTIPFQTGTTAGTVVFMVTVGAVASTEKLVIPPAPVAILSVVGIRTPTGIETRVIGIDNTRTIGQLVYTFLDATGVPLATITVDAADDFARYFQPSDAGGNFLLRSVFPVTGDSSRIAAFDVALANSAGTTRSARITIVSQ